LSRALPTAFLLALLTLALPRASLGDDSPRPAAARRVFVEIVVAGEAAAVSQMRGTARELLGRLEVVAVVVQADEEPAEIEQPSSARHFTAYVDLRSVAAPGLVVVESKTRRELARRVLPPSPSLEASVEAVAHVLYRVVESELDQPADPGERSAPRAREGAVDRRARPARSTPRAPSEARDENDGGNEEEEEKEKEIDDDDSEIAEPSPEASAERAAGNGSWGFDAGILFRGVSLGSGHYLPGGGVEMDVHGPATPLGFGFLLIGAGHPSTEIASGEAAAALQHYSVRAMPALDWHLGATTLAFAALGAGVDWFRASPEQTPPDALQARSVSSVDFVLGALLGFRLGLTDRTAIVFAGGLDLDLTPKVYVVDDGSGRQALLELPRLRPSLLAMLSFSIAGEPRLRRAQENP
jgi:hypothetical protein